MAEDDVEEMRNLRKQFQKSVGPGFRPIGAGRDAGSDDDEGESGEKGDFPSSTPESSYKFGTTLTSTAAPKKPSDDEETDAMARVMGFAGFASGFRKSRTFDIDSMVNDARKNASESRNKKDSDDSDDEAPAVRAKPKAALSAPRGPSGPFPAPTDSGNESEIGPPIPPSYSEAGTSSGGIESGISADLMDSDSDFSDTEDAPDDTSADWRIPCAYDITFEHGDKAVTALAIDPVGARFATGSVDYEVKVWDFGGMQANLNPFRTCKPCESHAIHNLSFSNGGEQILVISGSAQAKVIDRDGFNVLEMPKGFQFIRDMTHTKGHISMLTSGWFSPKVKNEFSTSSYDESLRLWTVDNKECHKACLKSKTAKGRLTVPTTCAYSKDGKFIASGCQDGSIQMWDTTKASFVTPAKIIRDAHKNDISSVCFSYDNKMLCSRGLDDTLKLWDLAMLKKPVFEASNLPSLFPQADCLFSPNDKLILTGTSIKKGEGQSRLVLYDRTTWQLVKEIPVADSSVIRTAWHPKLNQIFATTAEGAVKVFFDPNLSHNGALLCRTSKKRRAKQTDAVTSDYVITPFALPLFKEDKQRSKHAQFERNRKDPVKSHKPEIPMNGPGAGGRVSNAGGTLSSYLVRKLGYATKRVDADTNPREALLRHAKEAAENPYWVSPAYAKTQPKTIFQAPEGGEGSGESASKRPKL